MIHRRAAIFAMAAAGLSLALPRAAMSQGRPIRIVAFGDSLTAGFGLAGTAAFPAQLERALTARGYSVVVENAGVSGDTASGGASRVDWSVPDGTDAVILELGANDMLRGTDPQVTKQALESIISRLRQRRIEVLLCGMRAMPNLGAAYGRAFEAIYPELASKYGLIYYPFFLNNVITRAGLMLNDGLHPNADGVATIVANILPKVETLVARVRTRRAA